MSLGTVGKQGSGKDQGTHSHPQGEHQPVLLAQRRSRGKGQGLNRLRFYRQRLHRPCVRLRGFADGVSRPKYRNIAAARDADANIIVLSYALVVHLQTLAQLTGIIPHNVIFARAVAGRTPEDPFPNLLFGDLMRPAA